MTAPKREGDDLPWTCRCGEHYDGRRLQCELCGATRWWKRAAELREQDDAVRRSPAVRTMNPFTATVEELEAFIARPCGACGRRADEHIHLFGTQVYLCPTVQCFSECADPVGSETAGGRPE